MNKVSDSDDPDNVSQEKDSSKNQGLKIIFIVLGIFFLLGVVGVLGLYLVFIKRKKDVSSDIVEDVAQETVDDFMEDVGVDVDMDDDSVEVSSGDNSVSVDSNKKWPDSMPEIVPEFTYGEIVYSSEIASDFTPGTSWNVSLEDFRDSAFDDYRQDLESAGWEIDNYGGNFGFDNFSGELSTKTLTATSGDGSYTLVLTMDYTSNIGSIVVNNLSQ